jgi:hypothetical protein
MQRNAEIGLFAQSSRFVLNAAPPKGKESHCKNFHEGLPKWKTQRTIS